MNRYFSVIGLGAMVVSLGLTQCNSAQLPESKTPESKSRQPTSVNQPSASPIPRIRPETLKMFARYNSILDEINVITTQLQNLDTASFQEKRKQLLELQTSIDREQLSLKNLDSQKRDWLAQVKTEKATDDFQIQRQTLLYNQDESTLREQISNEEKTLDAERQALIQMIPPSGTETSEDLQTTISTEEADLNHLREQLLQIQNARENLQLERYSKTLNEIELEQAAETEWNQTYEETQARIDAMARQYQAAEQQFLDQRKQRSDLLLKKRTLLNDAARIQQDYSTGSF